MFCTRVLYLTSLLGLTLGLINGCMPVTPRVYGTNYYTTPERPGALHPSVAGISQPVTDDGYRLSAFAATPAALKFAVVARKLINAGVNVYTQGKYISIVMPNYLLFTNNTAEFTPLATNLLNQVVLILSSQPNDNILIGGHSSGIGSSKFELQLSILRAQKVASYLWAQGINNFKGYSNTMRRLAVIGYGNTVPLSNITSAAVRQNNSRIQITAYPELKDLGAPAESTQYVNLSGFDATFNTKN